MSFKDLSHSLNALLLWVWGIDAASSTPPQVLAER
jgi:hypothetical protein